MEDLTETAIEVGTVGTAGTAGTMGTMDPLGRCRIVPSTCRGVEAVHVESRRATDCERSG